MLNFTSWYCSPKLHSSVFKIQLVSDSNYNGMSFDVQHTKCDYVLWSSDCLVTDFYEAPIVNVLRFIWTLQFFINDCLSISACLERDRKRSVYVHPVHLNSMDTMIAVWWSEIISQWHSCNFCSYIFNSLIIAKFTLNRIHQSRW
jgi:hypothetical protein